MECVFSPRLLRNEFGADFSTSPCHVGVISLWKAFSARATRKNSDMIKTGESGRGNETRSARVKLHLQAHHSTV